MAAVVALLVFVGAVVGAVLFGVLWWKERGKARHLQEKFLPIVDVEEAASNLRAELERLRAEQQDLESLVVLEGQLAEMQSWGFYEKQYGFDDLYEFKAESDHVRAMQKDMVKDGSAAICGTHWQVEGSQAKGKKMVREQLKLLLRAFNGECDAAVARVRYNNVKSQVSRIEKSFAAINKLGATKDCAISEEYLDLKLRELRVAYEYEEKRQEEKEEQRRIREQMREEQRVEKERRKAIEEGLKEEALRARLLGELEEKYAAASEEQRAAYEAELQTAREALEATRRAISQAQLTKSGHVYIISNIGSFGEHVYKVGMTRRLDPMDRVRELGDASVPFHFDVHAMIYSEDAPALENALHRALEEHRVNRLNLRKEFFRVPLSDIVSVAERHHGQIRVTLAAEAREYRESALILANLGLGNPAANRSSVKQSA